MLAKLGKRRRKVSVIALFRAQLANDAIAAIGSIPGCQIVLACSATSTEIPSEVSAVRQKADESTIALVNRASALALGELVCILGPREDDGVADWRDLTASFAAEPRLGAVVFGHSAGCGLIARESLWTALTGLETAFTDWQWAVQDFCQRARSIGFLVPPVSLPRGVGADALLFRHRGALAPDCSSLAWSRAASDCRFTLYTAILDGYDTLKPQPAEALGGIEQVAFLDEATAKSCQGSTRGWRIATMAPSHGDPHRAARLPKIKAHFALPNSAYSLWIDASIGIAAPFPLGRLVDLFLRDCDICVFRHYARHSIFEEAEACKAYGLDRADVIDAQVARYRSEGLPESAGLIEAPVILRRHTDSIRRLNEAWWDEILRGSRRDQLSFNYVAWKLGLRYATFPLSLAAGNGLFVKFQRQKKP